MLFVLGITGTVLYTCMYTCTYMCMCLHVQCIYVDLFTFISLSLIQYHNLEYEALGPYGHQWITEGQIVPIVVLNMDVLKFDNGSIDPAMKTALFSNEDHWGRCMRTYTVHVHVTYMYNITWYM